MFIYRGIRFLLRVVALLVVLLLAIAVGFYIKLLQLCGKKSMMAYKQKSTHRFMRHLSWVLPVSVKHAGKRPGFPMLWVSNHISWLDIIVLGQVQPLSFLSKAEVRKWPLFGWLAECSGTLFIQRGQAQQQNVTGQIAEHLDHGFTIVLFPEGTSTSGEDVKKFYSRLFAASVETLVPVQPVALTYVRDGQRDTIAPFIGDDSLGSHLLRLLWNDRFEAHIQLLKPIGVQGRNRTQISAMAHEAISQAVNSQINNEQLELALEGLQEAS